MSQDGDGLDSKRNFLNHNTFSLGYPDGYSYLEHRTVTIWMHFREGQNVFEYSYRL